MATDPGGGRKPIPKDDRRQNGAPDQPKEADYVYDAGEHDTATVPFTITEWCRRCWPARRSPRSSPLKECIAECGDARNEDPVTTILWPPVVVPNGAPQAYVVVRKPPTDFDFSHMQYLPCGYGVHCKYGRTCTRAHSNPPQAEIAYWNHLQPLGPPSRRRRAANEKRTSGKDWSLTTMFECTVCGARMNSEAQLKQHEAGSKHKAQVAASMLKMVVGVAAPPAGEGAKVSGTATGAAPVPANTVVPHGTGPYYKSFMEASQTDGNAMLTTSGGGPRPPTGDALVKQMDSIRMHDLELPDPSDTHTRREIPRSLSEMALPTSRSNHDLNQAYITSVKAGDTAEVARYLRDGVEIDARDANCPALHWAIFMGRVDTVLLLIRSGARRNLEDSDQQTAVHICLHPRHGMLNQMKKEHVGSILAKKYEADAVKVLTALLQGGWSPDGQDALGRTGLHHVAEQGNCRLAQVLLQFSANPRVLNRAGYSPTDVATLKAKSEGLTKYVQLCDMLRQASFRSQSPHNMSPMGIPGELEADAKLPVRYPVDGSRRGGARHDTARNGGSDGATTPTNTTDDGAAAASAHAPLSSPPLGHPSVHRRDPFRESRDPIFGGNSDGASGTVYAHQTGGGGGTMLNDDGAFAEVEAVFRPLMAALCSFSGNLKTYTNQGVEKSVLATRLHQVVGGANMQVDAYIQAAVERGLITVHRGGRQLRQQFIAVAAKYSFYLARPIQNYSSTNLYGGSNTNIHRAASASHMGIGGMPSTLQPLPTPVLPMARDGARALQSGGDDAEEPEEPGLIESDFSDDDDGPEGGPAGNGTGTSGATAVGAYPAGAFAGRGLAAASVPVFPSVYHPAATAGPTTLFSEHDWGSAVAGAPSDDTDDADALLSASEGEQTLDYEALVGEVIRDVSPDTFPTGRRDRDNADTGAPPDVASRTPDRTVLLDQMRHSFLYDPFASSLGPEPLFPQHTPLTTTVPRSNTVSNVGVGRGAWSRDGPTRPPPGIPVPHSMASALGRGAAAAWRTDSAPVFPNPPARGPTTPTAATVELGWAAGVSAAGENDEHHGGQPPGTSSLEAGGWGLRAPPLSWAVDGAASSPTSEGNLPDRKDLQMH
eukprot:m.725190 g.725190  ORF g.725190 m.725190 type:complete len:1108 (+) comp23027_c0_seq2:332-3655(+)